jgi:cysteine desulfurase/selenocysteine lyase
MAVMNFDVNRARSYFTFDDGLIFLDHAGHSPLSIPTRTAYEKYFESWQKSAHRHDSESFKMFEELRAKLASMINSEPQRIGLAPHTSYGLNIVAAGLKWSKGDNVVISEKEFPANVYPWTR